MILEKKNSWKNNKITGHIGALITVICWGCSFIASKVLMEGAGMTPVEVYVYRFLLAYLMMLAFTFREIRSKTWKDELQMALCGICSGTLYFLLENYALIYTTTGNVSLLSAISPIFIAILLSVIYKTKMKRGEILGSVVAFAGVAFVILSESISKGLGMEIHPTGDFLAILCALSWAVYSIAIKRLIPLYNTLFLTRKLFFYGLITSMPLLLIQREPLHLGVLFDFSHPVYLLNLLFLAVMCSSMAYLLWNESMKIIGPLATNNYLYIQPPVTMFAGCLLLGETIYPFGYVGCALVLLGLVIADKMKK
ncbi:MAG: DMT family transporter [Muribaculaceae bacterium]|nr:DMT family transporter [Muribaculaceae bacterium]MDE6632732.1 DMT family transporter [Muribaculaceae bacterium]